MRTINAIVVLLATVVAGRAQTSALDLLSRIKVGSPSSYKNLTLFPLVGPASSYTGIRLLDEAIRSGEVKVQEKDGGEVDIAAIDPLVAMRGIGNPALAEIAERLSRVVSAI